MLKCDQIMIRLHELHALNSFKHNVQRQLSTKLFIKFYITSVQSRASRVDPTTLTLVGPKILLFMVNAVYFQNSGQTNNCQIEVLFKWLDQPCTPSPAPARNC